MRLPRFAGRDRAPTEPIDLEAHMESMRGYIDRSRLIIVAAEVLSRTIYLAEDGLVDHPDELQNQIVEAGRDAELKAAQSEWEASEAWRAINGLKVTIARPETHKPSSSNPDSALFMTRCARAYQLAHDTSQEIRGNVAVTGKIVGSSVGIGGELELWDAESEGASKLVERASGLTVVKDLFDYTRAAAPMLENQEPRLIPAVSLSHVA